MIVALCRSVVSKTSDSIHGGALKMAALWKPCHVKKKHVHVGGDWDNTGVWSESESPDVELEMYKVLVSANNQCAVEKKCRLPSLSPQFSI